MADLTKDSSILDLAKELRDFTLGPVRVALVSESNGNQKRLAADNVHSLGDLLTPAGEKTLYLLAGSGPKSMMALQGFLTEKGFGTDWPRTEEARERSREKTFHVKGGRGHGLSLKGAIEEADKQYAAKTGEPVGEFSRKIAENTEAQKDGARLKGRRTL